MDDNIYAELVAEQCACVIPELLRGNAGNVGEIGTLLDLAADEIDQLRAELATLRSPNLVWDSTNPEDSSVDSIEDAVYQYIDWFGDAKVGDELTFFVARKLPNVTVRITSVNEDGEVTFDVVNTALAAEGENSDV